MKTHGVLLVNSLRPRTQFSPQKIVTLLPRGVVACRSTDTVAVDDPVAAQAVEYIRENLSEKINIKVLACRLGIPRRTLDRHFEQAMAGSLKEISSASVSRRPQRCRRQFRR